MTSRNCRWEPSNGKKKSLSRPPGLALLVAVLPLACGRNDCPHELLVRLSRATSVEAAAVLSSLLLSSSGEQPSERQSCALAELLRAASIGPTLVDGSDAIVQVRISLDAWRGYARDLEALLRDRVTSRRQGSQKILIFHFTEAHGAWRLDWRLRDP